jgi:hypothetical protein
MSKRMIGLVLVVFGLLSVALFSACPPGESLPVTWSETAIRRMCQEEIQDAGARWAP